MHHPCITNIADRAPQSTDTEGGLLGKCAWLSEIPTHPFPVRFLRKAVASTDTPLSRERAQVLDVERERPAVEPHVREVPALHPLPHPPRRTPEAIRGLRR